MTRVSMRLSFRGFVLVAALPLVAWAAGSPRGLTFEALTPFRGDEIDEREEPYGSAFFLDVFSYRPSYRWEEMWKQGRTKYRGIAGSVKTDEFWTDQRLHFACDLTDWLHFGAQAVDAEDADSRYRRYEVGVDADLVPFLRAGVYGEVLPEKGEEDFGMRLALTEVLDHQITVGFEFPDVLMNTKGKDLERRYSEQPRSFTLDVRGRLCPFATWDWGARVNAPLELEDAGRQLEFGYEQVTSYGRIAIEPAERWVALLYWGAEGTDKDYRPLGTGSTVVPRDLDRRVYQARAEARYGLSDVLTPFAGFRCLRFTEDTSYLDPTLADAEHHHREYLGYAGLEIFLGRVFVLRPEIMGGHVDRVVRNVISQGAITKDHEFEGKASLPLDILFSRKAQLTALVSIDLDSGTFGGGSLGFQMVF